MDTKYWITETNQLLHNISQTFNKVYVNLISTLDLSNIARLQRSVEYCSIEHRYLLNECGCIDKGNATELVQLDEVCVHVCVCVCLYVCVHVFIGVRARVSL